MRGRTGTRHELQSEGCRANQAIPGLYERLLKGEEHLGTPGMAWKAEAEDSAASPRLRPHLRNIRSRRAQMGTLFRL
jgi:hypothetical protein